MRPGALEQRLRQQAEVLDRAVTALKPGGRIVYVTCSVLEEENGAQIRAFLGRHRSFLAIPPASVIEALGEAAPAFRAAALLGGEGLLMTPRRTGTDGFFVSILRHQD
jgi:16S rRNA (cytosine967-C5)-methyltransferase